LKTKKNKIILFSPVCVSASHFMGPLDQIFLICYNLTSFDRHFTIKTKISLTRVTDLCISSTFNSCRKKSDSESDGVSSTCNLCTRRLNLFGFHLPIPISAGTFFSAAAFVLGGLALRFYYDRTANRNLSPAESRNLVCQHYLITLLSPTS
jgi:hypothetical protein